MRELESSLAELRRLGLHLHATEAAKARARRAVRLNTRVYPLYRALGTQLLITAVVIHNLAVFGRVGWGVVWLATVAELFALLSWLALRKWFVSFGHVAGWDLSDLFFVADLAVWAGAIHVAGGPRSLIWFLPLLRVADHRAAAKAMAFAHLGPLAYLGVVLAAGSAVAWPVELAKLLLLYLAGLYIAGTGRPARRLAEEREAALRAATGFVERLRERTDRLDEAKQARSTLLDQLETDLRSSLVRIAGFYRYLIEQKPTAEAARGFVRQIGNESERALRLLDEAMARESDASPRVSVNVLLRRAAEGEAAGKAGAEPGGEGERTDPARLVLPNRDAVMHGDPERLLVLFGHLMAAGRHMHGGRPTVELELASETGSPERVVLRVGQPEELRPAQELLEPADEDTVEPSERKARLELSMARSIAQALGYRLEARGDVRGATVTLHLH